MSKTGHKNTVLIPATIAAWLAYFVIDFLMHAVILAGWWRKTESFWLSPEVLFQRIPFAYASFGIYAACLVWLMTRLMRPNPKMGRRVSFGAAAGVLVGLVQALAYYSVFDAPVSSLAVWPISVSLGSAGAAFAGGAVLQAKKPWKRLLTVLFAVLALLVVGVILQNIIPNS